MRRGDAVMVDRAQREFVAAAVRLRDAGHEFSKAREAKRRAEAALLAALERARKPQR